MTPKILHINNYPGNSGADLAFRTSVDLLRQRTDYTHWSGFVTDRDDADIAFDSWENHSGAGKLRYIYSPANRRRLASFLEARRPDIVHAHGFYSAISPSILRAIEQGRRRWNLKFVQTAHSHELICSNASAFDYTQNRICTDCKGHHPKLKIFYRNCDRRGWLYSWAKGIRCMVAQVLFHQVAMTDTIICPSELMMNNLIDEGIPDSKLALVRTPVQTRRYPPDTERLPEIVYFGRFSPEKNIGLLIDAFARFVGRFPDWKLILIGDGPERAHLEQSVRRAGLTDVVEFHPFLDHPVLFDRISKSRIMVMTSAVLETWGMVIPEAVMCGLYPVVPRHGSMKEVVEWLDLGLCYQGGNCDSLVEALVQAEGITVDTSAIESAQRMIEKELGPLRYVEHISGIYRELSGSRT